MDGTRRRHAGMLECVRQRSAKKISRHLSLCESSMSCYVSFGAVRTPG
jgi:hypothetical protein